MAANLQLPQRYNVITGVGKYELGDATDRKIVTTHTVHLIPVGLTGGAIDIKWRIKGVDPVTNGDNGGQKALYQKMWLNGVIGDLSYVSTQITSESIIHIPSTNMVPILDVAAISAGSWKVYTWAAEGTV